MNKFKFLSRLFSVIMVASLLIAGSGSVRARVAEPPPPQQGGSMDPLHRKIMTPAERQAAAQRAAVARAEAVKAGKPTKGPAAVPGGPPNYFADPNWANSPFPASVSIIGDGVNAIATATVGPTGAIASVTVVNGGTGYTLAATSVTAIGGGGSGAVLAPTIVGGVITGIAVTNGGAGYNTVPGMRKFVDSLPGLTAAGANNLGQYIPVGIADTATYPGSDYYVIALVQVAEKMHSDLPPTLIREYVQIETPANAGQSKHIALANAMLNGTSVPVKDAQGNPVYAVDNPHYLGPIIVSTRDKPVRILFHNYLPTGTGGDLFIPVDTTYMGAGTGPDAAMGTDCSVTPKPAFCYTENRATLHLHGGHTPWISDGTPHQWTTPATENTPYPKGVSVADVPDMPDPGPGALTFFYTNQQSARLMFYHDHAYGITRLNVYAGEAAGYLIRDAVEQGLIAAGTIPGATAGDEIPLVIQDKTFVPSASQLAVQDPTWDTTKWGGLGNLWFSHVYMPNQNPADPMGANGLGRWDYGPWFWPPYTNLVNGPMPNPWCPSPTTCPPGQPTMTLGVPNVSGTPETFVDTPVINGTAYPYLTVQPKAYRFRILNAANDRMFNLSLYKAASNNPMWSSTGTLLDANAGEVPMVPAVVNPAIPFPVDWTLASDGAGIKPDILDGRAMGVPDPTHLGPSWIQIGSEGGLLPAPVVIDPKPVGFQYNLRNIVVLNVSKHSLWLGPAERADVIVDFSQFAGQTLIMYNDSPAPVPAGDPRVDYYTGDLDMTSTGGAPTTLPGYGPNTRTVMQIRVAGTPAATTLAGIAVTSGGSRYLAPVVTLSGGGATTQATAQAVGAVDNIQVLNIGAGYTSAPTVYISDTMPGGGTLILPGPGTGASATATINTLTGKLSGLTLLSGGAGYIAPVVTFVGGGATTPATGIATMRITGINLLTPGAGYTGAPLVSIADTFPGIGSGASALATINLPAGVTPFNLAALQAAFASTATTPGAFAADQNPIIVPQADYNSAYNASFPTNNVVKIADTTMSFTPISGTAPMLMSLAPKAIQELFELQYGRMNATLGVELPQTTGLVQTTIPLGYVDPPTEILQDSITPLTPAAPGDGTQLWKITHNGVDTHAIHFHLFDVQVVNRVGWDGMIRRPDANELGWKDTVKMSPLEDIIVALRPTAPKLPFGLPDSIRPFDVTEPIGSPTGFTNIDPLTGNPVTVINQLYNFGWEYVWHCHILGHEENDMMRGVAFHVTTVAPPAPTLVSAVGSAPTPATPQVVLTWTDPTPPTAANLGNPQNEIGFRIERAFGNGAFFAIGTTLANQTTYVDTAVGSNGTYRYRVVAYNVSGDGVSNVLSVTTPAGTRPVAPSGLMATVQNGPQVKLTFTDNSTNETGFVIYRSVNGGAFATLVTLAARAGTGANVPYTDATVVAGNTYAYYVIAVNAAVTPAVNSAPSNTVSVPVPPNAPSNLRVTATAVNSIALAWRDNQVTPPETGFEIWRSLNGTTWTLAGTVGSNVTTFTDIGLTTRTTYYYRVRSYIVSAPTYYYSNWSNTVNATTR